MTGDQAAISNATSCEREPADLNCEGAALLSFATRAAKKRLWILEEIPSQTPGLNGPHALKVCGQLDLSRMQESIRQVLDRNQQSSSATGTPHGSVTFEDLTSHPHQRQKLQESGQSHEGHSSVPADGSARAILIRMNEQEYWVLLKGQPNPSGASITNDWLREIQNCYEALGSATPMNTAISQHLHEWQGEWSIAEDGNHLKYWEKQLESLPESLELPFDQPPPGRPRAMYAFDLDSELSKGLLQLSEREHATLFATLLAALQTLFFRYTAHQDLIVAVAPPADALPPSLRQNSDVLSHIPIRTRIAAHSTYRDILQRVKEAILEGYRHCLCSQEELNQLVSSQPSSRRRSLLQVMLVEETDTKQESSDLNHSLPTQERARFDLKLSFQQTEGGLRGVMEYNPDLFEPSTVETMIKRFQFLLAGITSNVEEQLFRYRLWEEGHRPGPMWSGVAVESRMQHTISGIVAEHAARSPEAMALVVEQETFTYGELQSQANQIAGLLYRNDLKPGDSVGIRLDRVQDALPAMLGVLQAGGVVVWLDPAELDRRLETIVEDSGATLVITEQKFGLPAPAVRPIYLDLSRGEFGEKIVSPMHRGLREDDLACILYRSSPEGRPEGIQIPHRALWAGGWDSKWTPSANQRVGILVNPNQEMTCLEVFRLLSSGACVVHLDQSLPPRKLASLLREHEVTSLWTSASVLERLAREFPRALKGLRHIFCDDQMGVLYRLREALKPDVLERTFGIYGWTEAGGNSLLYSLARLSSGPGRVDPTGHLAVGTQFHILDEKQQPVPQDVLGEIYIGSEALALGYHDRPQRTASAFYSSSSGQIGKLFRTGDWARRRADGTLEYRGRRDNRRVIGGVRVEIEEVEKLLRQHSAISDAVVIPQELSGLRDAGLVALIVPAERQTASPDEIRDFLKAGLPDVMLPHRIIPVESIPRIRNGELDRRLLHRMAEGQDASDASSTYVAPRTPMENQMAAIWAQTLGLERVGIHDNFFRLGGHSLLAAQAVARMSEVFQTDIPMARLFGASTIAEMAKVVEGLAQSRNAVGASS